MKKILILAGLLVLTASPALAQLREDQKWIEQADGGFIFPLSPANSTIYGRGLGGDILVGYRLNRDFSVSADVGYYECDQKFYGSSLGSWSYSPILILARYNFGPGWFRPFLILGGGIAVNSYSETDPYFGAISHRETDPLLSPGMGLLFIVSPDTAFYVQARFDLNFTTVGGPWVDNPSVFMPLKAGLSFFAL